MNKEPFIYLHARSNKRYRYNISSQLFEYSEPAKRTLINSICCKQWTTFKPLEPYLNYQLIIALQCEMLARYDTIYSL